MDETALAILLVVYLSGVILAWLSPLYLRSAVDRQALRQIALLWPVVLISVIVVFAAALIHTISPRRRTAP